MAKTTKLNLKDWQTFYLKKDIINGNLTASVLQTLYKNKYTSLANLAKIIDKSISIVLSGEGTPDLLLKFKELINITPKFYVTNYASNLNVSDFSNSDMKEEFMLSIKCDFIISINFDYFLEISDDYISSVNNALNFVLLNNDKILCKFIIKDMLYGNFFTSEVFFKKEIFESIVPYSGHSVKEIFEKFNIEKNSSYEKLLASSNYDSEINKITSNIKTISISFTPFHANNYLTMWQQKIYRDKFNIGKNDFKTKLIYLNADYLLKKEGKTIYDKLLEDFYMKYFSDEKIFKSGKSIFMHTQEKLDPIDSLLNDGPSSFILGNDKNILSDEYYEDYFEPLTSEDIFFSANVKELIFKSLKNEKVPKRDIDFLKNLDKDKLHIKKTFVEAIDKLTTPFLSKIIDTSTLKFLKQYLLTNYGENLKENVSDELKQFIEKKFKDYIQSSNCNFIEYFSELIKNLAEFTDEKEYIVEGIIKNSFIYRNFVFLKYFNVPKRLTTKSFQNILRLLNKEFYFIQDTGMENNLIIIPFMKIKEFLVYLVAEEINKSWEKLSQFFNNILPMINANVYSASLNEIEVNMTYFKDGMYDLFIKDRNQTRTFSIKTLEDIEYIFQDKELENLRIIIEELYSLHQKVSFGFNNKGDFNKYIELYDKRYNEYYIYKKREEEYEEYFAGDNFIITIIKKIFCMLPRSINLHNLFKTTKQNIEVLKKVNYYYIKEEQFLSGLGSKGELANIKSKISDFIDFKKDKKDSLNINEIKRNNSIAAKAKIYGVATGKSKPPPLIQLEENEKKLFNKIKDFLLKQKEIIFTLDDDSANDCNVVLYIKERIYSNQKLEIDENKILKDIDKKDINTIEEIGTKYSLIKRLVEKRYLVLKHIYVIKKDKKVYGLFLSKSYQHASSGVI